MRFFLILVYMRWVSHLVGEICDIVLERLIVDGSEGEGHIVGKGKVIEIDLVREGDLVSENGRLGKQVLSVGR